MKKLILEEIELPLEDGTIKLPDELQKIHDEGEKESNKAFKKSMDEIEEINKGDETVYIKPLKEQIELSEEDEEDLEEALPRDLAKAYKNKDLSRMGDKGNNWQDSNYGYKNIKKRGDSPVDFDKSNYIEITPDEAKELKKNGELDRLRVIYDGQLVTFGPDGKQEFRATRSRRRPSQTKFHKPNGDEVDYSNKLTFNTVVDGADKIYIADETAYDPDLYADRGQSADSYRFNRSALSDKNINYRLASDDRDAYMNKYPSYSDQANFEAGSKYRGASNQGSSFDVKRLKNQKASYINRLEEYTKALDDLNRRREEVLNGNDEDKADVLSSLDREIAGTQTTIDNYTKYIADTEKQLKYVSGAAADRKARERFMNSEIDLSKPSNEFREIRKAIKTYENEARGINDSIDKFNAEGGSEESRYNQNKYNRLLNDLAEIQRAIAKLKVKVELSDEVDAAAMAKFNSDLAEINNKLSDANSIKDKLLGRNKTNESLNLNEATIKSDLDSYEPWGGAQDTYDEIIYADKEDELDQLLTELYPEGIDLTQLNDILWFERDFILGELGLADKEPLEDDQEEEEIPEEDTNIPEEDIPEEDIEDSEED